MRRFYVLFLAALFVAAPAAAQDTTAAPPAPPTAGVDTDQQVAAAREAGEAWLELVDAADYEQSWEMASPMLQDQVTQEQWVGVGEQVDSQVGALESRIFSRGQYATSLPNVPEGEYVVLVYSSQFANAGAQEIVVMAREDEDWNVAGYRVRPAPGGQQ
jgi:hypothetical protein